MNLAQKKMSKPLKQATKDPKRLKGGKKSRKTYTKRLKKTY